MRIIPITKATATTVCGSVTATSKMPCPSYSLPTESCNVGYNMAKMPGSICSKCYANKGNYARYENNIKPAQFARLDSVWQAMADSESATLWVSGIVAHIGNNAYFRWHDSGDLQGLAHLELIVAVCNATPGTMHWLPTREYAIVKAYIEKHGAMPKNLIVRLSAMYPDQPVKIPASLQNIKNVTTSNVHTKNAPIVGQKCKSVENNGACGDCRLCWTNETVSYEIH